MLMAKAGFSIEASKNWAFTLFADNISNERGSPSKEARPIPDLYMRVRPRTIGVQVEYRL